MSEKLQQHLSDFLNKYNYEINDFNLSPKNQAELENMLLSLETTPKYADIFFRTFNAFYLVSQDYNSSYHRAEKSVADLHAILRDLYDKKAA